MTWAIEISTQAEKTLDKLQKEHAQRILRFLFERVQNLEDPRSIGEALRGSRLGTYWKCRVGDYRLVADIHDNVLTIVVVQIGNRREVYR